MTNRLNLRHLLWFFLTAVVSTLSSSVFAFTASGQSWREDFSGSTLSPTYWTVSNWSAPGSLTNNHSGVFQSDRVSLSNGYLALKLTQEYGTVGTNFNGIISRGGEIASTRVYGYGTYEWRARAASTSSGPLDSGGVARSGNITGMFNYVNNSETEIDFEVEGQYPSLVEMTNWHNPYPSGAPTWPDDRTYTGYQYSGTPNLQNGFHVYKFVWSPGSTKFYVDDVLRASHTTDVPSAAAYLITNLWGTNNSGFGGLASVGTTQYMYIDWIRYTAPGEAPVPDPGATPSPTVQVVSFKDLTSNSKKSGGNWRATVTITVQDAATGAAISNAAVSGSFSIGGGGSCLTDIYGRCTITSAGMKYNAVSSTTFTGTNISGTNLSYDASKNIKNQITIYRP